MIVTIFKRYAIYIQEFCSSNTFNEDVKTVALRSIKLHKQSLALYKLCMTVLFELNDFEMLNKVTNAAFHHLPKDDQWSIIMHNIVLVLLHNDSKFEDVERLYLQSTKVQFEQTFCAFLICRNCIDTRNIYFASDVGHVFTMDRFSSSNTRYSSVLRFVHTTKRDQYPNR